EELRRLESIAASKSIAILSDEVFCDYGFGEDRERVTTLTGPRKAPTFSMSGLSKIAGLPQMKLGWIVASGPDLEHSLEALELIADTSLSVSTPVQIALPSLLASAEHVQSQIRARIAANLAMLRERLAGSPVAPLRVEGGWYTILQMPRTRSEEEWAMMLLRD